MSKRYKGWLYIASMALALLGLLGTSYTSWAQELWVLGKKVEDPLRENASGSSSGRNLQNEKSWNGEWSWEHQTRTLRINNLTSNMPVRGISVADIPNFRIEVVGTCRFLSSESGYAVVQSKGCPIRIEGEDENATLYLRDTRMNGVGILVEGNHSLLIQECYLDIEAGKHGLRGGGSGAGATLSLSMGARLEVRGGTGSIVDFNGGIDVLEDESRRVDLNASSLARVTIESNKSVKHSNGAVVYEADGAIVKEWVMLAPYYPVEVGGLKLRKYLTRLTHNDFPSVIATGSVEYDANEKSLTLDDATITPPGNEDGIVSSHPVGYLTIKCKGANKITTKMGAAIHAKDQYAPTITGEGDQTLLELYPSTTDDAPGIWEGSAEGGFTWIGHLDLKIKSKSSCFYSAKNDSELRLKSLNATLSTKGDMITGFKTLVIEDTYIVSPKGAYVEGGAIYHNGSPLYNTTCQIKRDTTPTYNITIDPNIEHGTLRVANYRGSLSSVPMGTNLIIEAIPDEGYQAARVFAGGEDITESKSFVVRHDAVITAQFTPSSYEVTAKESPNGRVLVKGYGDLKRVPYGKELIVVVNPYFGYTFAKLTANGVDITATKRFVVRGATTVEATFDAKPFTVRTKTPQHGKIELSHSGSVAYGTEVTVTVTPDVGYRLSRLIANGVQITDTKKFVVKGNTMVEAFFVSATYPVTAMAAQHGKIVLRGYGDLRNVPQGKELSVLVIPNVGYSLTKLTANDVDIMATKTFVVEGPTIVEATFARGTDIEEVTTSEVLLFPNPAADAATLSGLAAGAVVQVFSLDGVELFRTRSDESGVAHLDLAGLAAGKYFVRSAKTMAVLLVVK